MKEFILVLIFLFVYSSLTLAQSNQIELATEKYKPENWPGKTEPNKPGCPLGKVEVNGLEGGKTEHKPGFSSHRAYKKENKNVLGIEVQVCNSAEEAQNKLLEFLAGLTTAATMPSLYEKGLEIGNIGFICENNGSVVWIAFVRNNVLIIVSCYADEIEEVISAAEAFDKAIKEQKDTQEITKPEITKFDAKSSSIEAGANADLEIEVESGTSEPADYHFEISGNGQGYVEKRADGTYYFKATGPGKVTIKMTATNELCNSSTSEVTIEITK